MSSVGDPTDIPEAGWVPDDWWEQIGEPDDPAPLHPEILAELHHQRVRREARRLLDAEERPAAPFPEIITLRNRLARPAAAVAYRIDRWHPVGARVVLAAQFKAGKTTMTGNLLRSLVDGDPWLGQYDTTPIAGTAVLLDVEMSQGQLDRWLAAQHIRADDRVVPVSLRGKASTLNILDPAVRAHWARELRAVGAEYLVLDPLRPVLDALGLDEMREAGRFLAAFDELLGAAGIAEATVVHHMGHNGERSRGDSRLRDWPDVEWRLVRQTEDPSSARYVSAYGRDVDVPESLLAYDPESRRLSVAGGSRREVAGAKALGVVLNLVGAVPGLSGRQIEDRLGESTPGVSREEIRAGVREGFRAGFLRRERRAGRGGGYAYHLDSSALVRGSARVVRQRSEGKCASAPIDGALHLHTEAGASAPSLFGDQP